MKAFLPVSIDRLRVRLATFDDAVTEVTAC
jgi:hypothetical protein